MWKPRFARTDARPWALHPTSAAGAQCLQVCTLDDFVRCAQGLACVGHPAGVPRRSKSRAQNAKGLAKL